MNARSATWRPFLPAFALAILGIGALGVVRVMPTAEAAQPVAVFDVQGDALAAVLRAGGRMLGPGGMPGSIIAISDSADFIDRLYAAGANLVLRANDSLGCVSTSSAGPES
ncbi:hypothetical protein [Dongia mobilis]|jgi:hypothetical protein|uniref:hypothetical protein n=1 Tax=Dongia sp. TaxID=1977262 RepID=UPI0026EB2F8E